MIAHLEPEASTFIQHPHPNLILHCGARAAERKEIIAVPTPRPTESWSPIPHIELVKQVEGTLRSNGLVVGTQAHSLTHDGMRYFGLMEIHPGGATMVEFNVEVPGNYVLVDHALSRLQRGLAGVLVVEGDQNPEIYNGVPSAGSGH